MNERESNDEREKDLRAKKTWAMLEMLPDGLHHEDSRITVDFSVEGDTLKKRFEYKKPWLTDNRTPVEAGTVIISKGDAVIAELLSPLLLDMFTSKVPIKDVPEEPDFSKLPKGLLDRMDLISSLMEREAKECMASGKTTYHNAIQTAAGTIKKQMEESDARSVLCAYPDGHVQYGKNDLISLVEEQSLNPVKNTFKSIIDRILGRDKNPHDIDI